jgi:UPF0716 family protein affecting phage T7 exclusion
LGLATPVFYETILLVFLGMTIGSVFFGWLITFAFLGGVSNCAFSEGTLWPVVQAILPPELRGSNRAVISMGAGAVSAVMLILSGVVADNVGVSASLLWFVPVPIMIRALVWTPMSQAYPRDRTALHNLLSLRREDLMNNSVSSNIKEKSK